MDNEQLWQLIKEELKGNQQAIQEIKTEMKAMDSKIDAMGTEMKAMDSRLNTKIDASATQQADFLKQQTEAIMTMTEDRIRGVEVLIENDIGKRIDTLCDGYKLNHEKQWDLEKRVEVLERKLGIA